MFGMVERGEQARLAQQLAEVEVLPVRNLDRDLLVDPGVFREVDGAEAAAAERREDAVLPEGLAAEEHLMAVYRSSVTVRLPRAHRMLPMLPDCTRRCRSAASASRCPTTKPSTCRACCGSGSAPRSTSSTGAAAMWRAAVVERGKRDARRVRPLERRRAGARDARPRHAAPCSVLKGDKMDDVVRDAVMLGVAAIQPMVSARTEIALAALAKAQPRGALAAHRRVVGEAVRPGGGAARFAGAADLLDVTWRAGASGHAAHAAWSPRRRRARVVTVRDVPRRGGRRPASGPRRRLDRRRSGGRCRDAGAACCRSGARTLRADAVPLVALTALLTTWSEL